MQLDINDESIRVRYLNKQLSEEQEIAFEEYLMENPELIEELKLTQCMLDMSAEAVAATEKHWFTRLSASLALPQVSFPLGAVCGGGLAAMLMLTMMPSSPDKSGDKGPTLYSSPSVVFIETTLGAAGAEVNVPLDHKGMATLFIQTADTEATEYQLRLLDSATNDILKTETVTANGNGELVLVMNLAQLPTERLHLELSNATTEKLDVHRLVVLRP